jgi:hypothetical protein
VQGTPCQGRLELVGLSEICTLITEQCGGERPSCLRCTNISVTCPGYVKRSVFVDERANIERRARRRKTIVSHTP